MGGVTPTGGRVASRMMVLGFWRRVDSHVGVTRGFMKIRLRLGRIGAVGVHMRSSFGRCPHLRIEIWGTRHPLTGPDPTIPFGDHGAPGMFAKGTVAKR